MLSPKKAFSLIEVIISASILSIAVFWVYKLIWENSKTINNINNFSQSNFLIPLSQECIDYIWFDTFKSSALTNYNLNLWNNLDSCNTTSSTGILLDSIEYYIEGIITNSWSNFIEWSINISSDQTKEISHKFIQIKK